MWKDMHIYLVGRVPPEVGAHLVVQQLDDSGQR